MATKGWSMSALSDAIKSLALWEPIDAYSAAYPVGAVIMFDSTLNPNDAFPGTTWVQIVHGRTVRAAATLSAIGTEAGSDDRTLTVAEMPTHIHLWSGSISSTDIGTDTTSSSGAHTHSFSFSMSSAGAHTHPGRYSNSNPAFDGGTSNARTWDIADGGTTSNDMIQSAGAHTHSVGITTAIAGSHTHTVAVGAHSHTVSGTVASYGSGTSFNYTNTCHMYGMWKRTG